MRCTMGVVLKRKRSSKKMYRASRKSRGTTRAMVKKIAKSTLMKNLETIKSVSSISDGQSIAHNSYISLSDNLLYTTQGDKNPETAQSQNRRGDKITLRGVSLKFMVELLPQYTDVSFRLFVIRCAVGDAPTRNTLFTGMSGNKMIDTINTDRFTVLYQKNFKLKTTGVGGTGPAYSATGSGVVYAEGTTGDQLISRATRVVKCWIPGKRFTRSGVIQYQNESPNPKLYEYRCLLFAYSNYTTLQDIFNVAVLNDVVRVMYYKDA